MARIPWTEKYRPVTLDDIVGNKNIIATLKGFIITQVVPQLIILWGLPGIGKTSAAFAFARDYYIRKGIYDEEGKLQPGYFPPLQVMRGAVGIEDIRSRVHEFMRHAPPAGARRIIIFDEAEMMSREALLELRPYIERYAKTCSIIFTTNVNPATWLDYFDPLLGALRDRALIYHFEPPSTEDIATHLRRIVSEEKFEILEEKDRSIAAEAEGSVRKAVELLQAEYARIIAMKPPLVEWATAWADYNVVSRNFEIFPPDMLIEVKKFVREWERKYGKGIKAMGAPLQPCTVEDAKRMEQYSEYVKATPEVPERFPTAQSVVNYAVDDALTHIAGDYILKNVRRIFQSEGREAARKFLKENIRHYGSYGPGRPGLTGTPTGIRVSYKGKDYTVTWNEILNRALEPAYNPTYKEVPEVPPPVPEVPEKPPKPPPVAIPPPVEKGLTKEDEEEMRTEFQAILLRRTVSPRKWMPIFRDEMAKWKLELADWPRDRAKKEAKTDLTRRLIPDIIDLAKPPKVVKEAVKVKPPKEVPVPTRIEIGVERKPNIVSRYCWKCDEAFEIDRDLERRVRETITEIRGVGRVVYQRSLLRLPMLFYYLCEEHRKEKFGYDDIYDAIAFRISEARKLLRPEKAYTLEELRRRGFTPEDILRIQEKTTKYG